MADQLHLTYCCRLYGLSAFCNRPAVLRKLLSVAAKTEIWNSCEYHFLRKNMEIAKNLKI